MHESCDFNVHPSPISSHSGHGGQITNPDGRRLYEATAATRHKHIGTGKRTKAALLFISRLLLAVATIPSTRAHALQLNEKYN